MLTKNPAHSRLDLNAAQSIKMAFTAPYLHDGEEGGAATPVR